MKRIKQFGEKYLMTKDGIDKKSYEAFIEFEDGSKEACDESRIEQLWWQWIGHKGVYRNDQNGFTVFAYTDCIEFNNDSFLKMKKYTNSQPSI